jgi:cobalamin biosynthesis Mg chelatase CobN
MRALHPPALLAALKTFSPRSKEERTLCEKLRASLSGPPQQPRSKQPAKTRREKEAARRAYDLRVRRKLKRARLASLSNAEQPSKRVHPVSEQSILPAQQSAQKRPATVSQNVDARTAPTTNSANESQNTADARAAPTTHSANEEQKTADARAAPTTHSANESQNTADARAAPTNPSANEEQTPAARNAPNHPPSLYSLRWLACLAVLTLLPLPPLVRVAAFVLLCWHLWRHG